MRPSGHLLNFPFDLDGTSDIVLPPKCFGLINLHQRAVNAIIEWIRCQLPTMAPARLADAAVALHALEELPWAPWVDITISAPGEEKDPPDWPRSDQVDIFAGSTLSLRRDELEACIYYNHYGPAGHDSESVCLLRTTASLEGPAPGYKEENIRWFSEEDYVTGLDDWVECVRDRTCEFEFVTDLHSDLDNVRIVPRNWQELWLDRSVLIDEDEDE